MSEYCGTAAGVVALGHELVSMGVLVGILAGAGLAHLVQARPLDPGLLAQASWQKGDECPLCELSCLVPVVLPCRVSGGMDEAFQGGGLPSLSLSEGDLLRDPLLSPLELPFGCALPPVS